MAPPYKDKKGITLTDTNAPLLFEETLAGGATWSHILKRGSALRITDPEGGANTGAMFYNADNPTERYNMPDTLKAQHTARLTSGHAIYSDMGRILCSLVADTCGWHDPISGHATAAQVRAKYGEKSYQQARNAFHQNARDGFLIELAKYGLGQRDLVANINFFSKVAVSNDGSMHFHPANSKPGDFVELRAEMNTLVILNTCQHPLDPAPAYRPKSVNLSLWRVTPPGLHDCVRTLCPENARGLTLTERYFV
jgi:urea carboxylase-associated protein 2